MSVVVIQLPLDRPPARESTLVSESAFSAGVEELSEFVNQQARVTTVMVGFGYRASECAPSSFSELQSEFKLSKWTCLPLRVSCLHSASSIFKPEVNLAFRFWHDCTHISEGADFARPGEAVVAQEQLRQLEVAGYKPRSLVWQLLFCETFGQTECAHRTGSFPSDQRLFTAEFLEFGLPAAIERESDRQCGSRESSNVVGIGVRPRTVVGGDAA